ncbi:hypothetical protein FEM48_Zijuj03G0170700 [Ziziphus jujuba var. spinosa]|uniref:Abscisic acid receptor PYL8-like n=1 Tax=Ziziphus jujuba var. spinosa TaxID=714518 RepID=A0A978VRJ6_ZIZJJ|nr:hypothetical protein FEM48_Zijuj03G0170700 [Ziziphus jujuba var. spinosa]
MFPSLRVWSLVRRFDQPQKYKPFISRCVVQGNLEIGSLREVDVKSGLPATTSTERLELLDDDEHILRIRIIGGDHRLRLTYAIDTMSLARCRLLLLEAMETGYSVPLNRESARIDIWKLAAELIALVISENYSSVISLHPEIIDGRPGTLVIESFVVDVPEGNTKDETCYFVEALIKCNLKSLADVSERLAIQDRTEPIDRI